MHGFALQSCKSILQSKDEHTNVFMLLLVIYIEHIIGRDENCRSHPKWSFLAKKTDTQMSNGFHSELFMMFLMIISKLYINQIGPNIATPRRNGGVTPGFLPKMSVFLWLDHA